MLHGKTPNAPFNAISKHPQNVISTSFQNKMQEKRPKNEKSNLSLRSVQSRLEVRLEDETVWLTQVQMVILFNSSKANISEHIKSIYEQGELAQEATVRIFRTLRQEGNRQVSRTITYYNLDLIISVGFRVNTKRGILFRQWANSVLKDYLLKGYSINQRFERLEQRVSTYSTRFHDRFLIIDDTVYHFGASFKDLGRRLFAFTRMEAAPAVILSQL